MAGIDKELWAELKPLLDQVLELSAAERAAWIEALRVEKPTLARELEALLEVDAAPTGALWGEAGLGDARDLVGALAGRTVDKYTLERPIGHGGMGTVWLGHRSDGRFEGKVAVKLLNLALIGRAGEERFAQEGTVLARLTHPNIARLHDAGVTPGGQPFLVLEYVPGLPIDTFADRRRLSVDQRIALFLEVLAGVASAHANLIVHRDIKPSNIMVTDDGAVKLLDFGIAKLLNEGRSQASSITDRGDRALTPEYAAPEQIRGEPVSTATDVYSLGVLLYLLLGGKHPTGQGSFTPSDHLRTTLDVEPSRLGLGDLDNILAKALRKNPAERYPTVAAFGDDLTRFRSHQPVSARPDSWRYRGGRFVRRHRGAVIAASVAVLSLVAATGISLREARMARLERDRAAEALKRGGASSRFASLIFRLMDPGGPALNYRQLLAKGREVLQKQMRNDPVSWMQLSFDFAQQYLRAEDGFTADTLLRRTVTIADSLGLPRWQARTRCELVFTFEKRNLADSALATIKQAREFLSRAPDADGGTLNACDAAEGSTLLTADRATEAIPYYARVVERHRKDADTTSEDYINTLNDYNRSLYRAGRVREAMEGHRMLLHAIMAGEASDPRANTVITYNIAADLKLLGEFRARHDFLGSQFAKYPELGPLDAFEYGWNFDLLEQPDSAAVWYRRALSRPDPFQERYTCPAHVRLLRIARRAGRSAEILSETHAADSACAGARLQLVRGIVLMGRMEDSAAAGKAAALRVVRAALDTLEYPKDSTSIALIDPLLAAATALDDAGAWAEALPYALRVTVMATVDSAANQRSGRVGAGLLLQARAAAGLGHAAEARALRERALPGLRNGLGPQHRLTRQAESLLHGSP